MSALPIAPLHSAPPYPENPIAEGPRSGLLHLRNSVAEYFALYKVPAEVPPVGLKYRSFNSQNAPSGNRVCFIPGDFDGTAVPRARAYGSISRVNFNSVSVVNPRELARWDRIFTIAIWGNQPPGKLQDESAALEVAEGLLEQVARAMQMTKVGNHSAAASWQWGEVFENAPPVENPYGCELLVKCTMASPLFDRTLDVVQAKPGTITR